MPEPIRRYNGHAVPMLHEATYRGAVVCSLVVRPGTLATLAPPPWGWPDGFPSWVWSARPIPAPPAEPPAAIGRIVIGVEDADAWSSGVLRIRFEDGSTMTVQATAWGGEPAIDYDVGPPGRRVYLG